MNTDTGLKPCPFCGGDAALGTTEFDGDTSFYVFCKSETCPILTAEIESKEEVIEKWNSRTK